MSKVLGTKVSDEVYERVSSFGNKSKFIRLALSEYFKNHYDELSNKVNHAIPPVNQKLTNNKYEDIKKQVDRL